MKRRTNKLSVWFFSRRDLQRFTEAVEKLVRDTLLTRKKRASKNPTSQTEVPA